MRVEGKGVGEGGRGGRKGRWGGGGGMDVTAKLERQIKYKHFCPHIIFSHLTKEVAECVNISQSKGFLRFRDFRETAYELDLTF